MLYRFRETQAIELGLKKPKEKRPYLASEVKSLPEAEKWRQQVIRDVARGSLTETQIRDINDEINKYLREKGHWENQIKKLGGPDYRKIGPKMLDHEGKELPNNRGYK
ncbi:NineTeen Complex (NTC) component [Mycoemilia scoparia]|uniref:NineTeen Complex (NTC) component n=1 Tax=Mycoemilia scoparia TaxID=417184 RepID=A0A9W8DRP7_9FUNG|nr:NineTeen Complex (NTC) component [Mycoemilia scoparia]